MCIQESTAKMRKALDGSGRKIVYYIDSGNPTSPQRVYNPANLGVTFDEALVKVATNPTVRALCVSPDELACLIKPSLVTHRAHAGVGVAVGPGEQHGRHVEVLV